MLLFFSNSDIIPVSYTHLIKEHNIDLVARPTLDVKEADDEKAVLVFTCTVLPEVTLGEYKGLDIRCV